MSEELPFAGMTILLVEDEPLIAIDIVMTFEEAGATMQGPYLSAADALEAMVMMETTPPACAVLDYELGQTTCDDIAICLSVLNVPIVLYTASPARAADLARHVDAKVVLKAPSIDGLIAAVRDSTATHARRRSHDQDRTTATATLH